MTIDETTDAGTASRLSALLGADHNLQFLRGNAALEEKMNTCYSLNDEDFCLSDFGDVIDSLESDGRCEVGETYYEADFRHIAPKDVVSVSRLIEDMDERLYEEVGEAADDGLNASKEAVAELEAYLLQWVEKHADIKRYFVIEGKSREKQITADDLTPNAELSGLARPFAQGRA